MQNFYCDIPVVLEIVSEIHRRHAARAKLALDAVTVSERFPQSLVGLRHQRLINSEISTVKSARGNDSDG
jgi:hypothetical protein